MKYLIILSLLSTITSCTLINTNKVDIVGFSGNVNEVNIKDGKLNLKPSETNSSFLIVHENEKGKKSFLTQQEFPLDCYETVIPNQYRKGRLIALESSQRGLLNFIDLRCKVNKLRSQLTVSGTMDHDCFKKLNALMSAQEAKMWCSDPTEYHIQMDCKNQDSNDYIFVCDFPSPPKFIDPISNLVPFEPKVFPKKLAYASEKDKIYMVSDRVKYYSSDPVAHFAVRNDQENFGAKYYISVKADPDLEFDKKVELPASTTGFEFLLFLSELSGYTNISVNLHSEIEETPLYSIPIIIEEGNKEWVIDGMSSTYNVDYKSVPLQFTKDKINSNQGITTTIFYPQSAEINDLNQLDLKIGDESIPFSIVDSLRWYPNKAEFGIPKEIMDKIPFKWVRICFVAKEGSTLADYTLNSNIPTTSFPVSSNFSIENNGGGVYFESNLYRFGLKFGGNRFMGISHFGDRTKEGEKFSTTNPPYIESNGKRYLPYIDSTKCTNDQGAFSLIQLDNNVKKVILLKGDYIYNNQSTNESDSLCQFVTRFTFYKDVGYVQIDHSTILEDHYHYSDDLNDTIDDKPISDIGWDFHTKFSELEYEIEGSENITYNTERGNVSLLQYSWENYSIELFQSGNQNSISHENVSDGRLTGKFVLKESSSDTKPLYIDVKDFSKKFPLQFINEPSANIASLHFWPKNGKQHEPNLADQDTFRLKWAHRGDEIDVRIPNDYLESFRGNLHEGKYESSPNILNLPVPVSTIGTSVANTFFLSFREDSKHEGIQAIAKPSYNAFSKHEGNVLPFTTDSDSFSEEISPILDNLKKVFPGYNKVNTNYRKEYGKWIYGSMHNNQQVHKHSPEMHRLFSNSHYRNIYGTQLAYFLCGDSANYESSTVNFDNFLNNSFFSLNKSTPYLDKTNTIGQNNLAGNFKHVSTSPFGMHKSKDGNNGHYGHWIDVSALVLGYLVLGEDRGIDAYQLWKKNRIWTDFANYTNRELSVNLGELIYAYSFDYDPNSLMMFNFLYDNKDTFEKRSYIDLPTNNDTIPDNNFINLQGVMGYGYHKNMENRIYELNRDERTIEIIKEALLVASNVANKVPQHYYGNYALFKLNQANSNAIDIQPFSENGNHVSTFINTALTYYDNPGSDIDGLSFMTKFDNGANFFIGAPYFLYYLKKRDMVMGNDVKSPLKDIRNMDYPLVGNNGADIFSKKNSNLVEYSNNPNKALDIMYTIDPFRKKGKMPYSFWSSDGTFVHKITETNHMFPGSDENIISSPFYLMKDHQKHNYSGLTLPLVDESEKLSIRLMPSDEISDTYKYNWTGYGKFKLNLEEDKDIDTVRILLNVGNAFYPSYFEVKSINNSIDRLLFKSSLYSHATYSPNSDNQMLDCIGSNEEYADECITNLPQDIGRYYYKIDIDSSYFPIEVTANALVHKNNQLLIRFQAIGSSGNVVIKLKKLE